MEATFTAAPHHDVLALLIQLAILLGTARLLGELAQRLGQPTVVGEILAGIVLGPSLLSGLVPAIGDWIVPHNPIQGYLLETVSLLGVMFLLLLTGLETDVTLIRRQIRSALGVATGGLLLPLIMGFLLGQVLPDYLLGKPDQRFVFALFLAIAMSISAIPVVAKVLMDLNMMRRDIGQTIIAAAMIDDTVGWILLSIVIGLAGGATVTAGSVAQSVISVVAFMGISFTLGKWLLSHGLVFVQEHLHVPNKMLSFVVFCMFAWGAIGQALGLEALLGAFIVGILFSQLPRLNSDVVHLLEKMTVGIFAPIFFAVAGLKVNILALLNPELFGIALLVIAVATFCKLVGVYLGARLIGGRDHWSAVFFGAGLNARGSMEIIIATIGLSLGVLTQELFSVIVVMAVTTSLMAPFLLRWASAHIQPEAQELERLKREQLNRNSLVAHLRRVLVPVRPRADNEIHATQSIEALLLARIHQRTPLELTLFSVSQPSDRAATGDFLNKLTSVFIGSSIHKKVLPSEQASDAILKEAQKDYDLLVIGTPEGSATYAALFTPLVDEVVRFAPCPTMIVHGHQSLPADWQPTRILIATNGSLAAQRAAEVAFALALPDAEVTILRVVEENYEHHYLDASGTLVTRQLGTARKSVEQLRQMGEYQGIVALTEVRVSNDPDRVILQVAQDRQIDLIILGTSISPATDRLYLGPRVERIVNSAPCPVVIINS